MENYTLSNYTLTERARYAPATLADNLPELMEELTAWRELADTPADAAQNLADAEEWQNIKVCQDYKSPEHAEQAIQEYVSFYYDCVRTIEGYHGRFMGTDRPDTFHQYIAEEVEKRDEYQTALINIREAIKNGEPLDYLASLIPDNIGA